MELNAVRDELCRHVKLCHVLELCPSPLNVARFHCTSSEVFAKALGHLAFICGDFSNPAFARSLFFFFLIQYKYTTLKSFRQLQLFISCLSLVNFIFFNPDA